MDSVPRTPASTTKTLLAALRPLTELFGVPPEEAAAMGFGRFPVQGEASYVHDWWFPRFGPSWRLHQGTDIFAPTGTPVRAPAAGTLTLTMNGLGGLSAYVTEADGTYHYLAHLAGYAPDVQSGQPVRLGQIVGFVGNSGNARATPPHLHYEIHPRGGAAVDPKPYLDGWIEDAVAGVPGLIARYERRLPRVVVTTAATRSLGPRSPQPVGRLAAAAWAGALGVAMVEAERAAATVDWVPIERAAEQRAADWAAREKVATLLVDPVTPAPLRRALSPGSSGTGAEARSPRP